MPVDEEFSRYAKRDFAGTIVFISRNHNKAWWENIRQVAF
jgi:hypothetical protein